ncbi:MAG TPA: hypothetical protein VGO93_02265 [Candidatus Xenobia bacterium]|jgi:hypothetical protein
MRHVAVLFVVLAAVGGMFRIWHPSHVTPPVAPAMGLNGIEPGLSRAEVYRRLGPADGQGPLTAYDGMGSWSEWGSKTCTWNGKPTVSFTASGKVLCIIGNEYRTAKGAVRLGSTPQDVVFALGPPPEGWNSNEPNTRSLQYHFPDSDLDIMVTREKVTRMLWHIKFPSQSAVAHPITPSHP